MSDEIMDDEVSTPSDEQSGGGASKTFTQADVDKILEQRLARERKRFEKMTDGVDIDEAKRVLAEREQAELERQKERGEFENVLKKTVEKKDMTIQSLTSKLHQIQVDGALLNAASTKNAVSPEQVSALLKGQTRLSDDGQVEILDKNGSIRYNDNGELLSVNELMEEFLTANPHFVRASAGGAGSSGNAGGSTQKPSSVAQMLSNWENGGREAFAASKKRK
jgi:hypothetical protein